MKYLEMKGWDVSSVLSDGSAKVIIIVIIMTYTYTKKCKAGVANTTISSSATLGKGCTGVYSVFATFL